MFTPSRVAVCLTALLIAFAATAPVRADGTADPPGRVARLSVVRGNVSFSPAGEKEWVQATLNRPLIAGDRLWTDHGRRAELQFGASAVRLDEASSLQILNLDDRTVQLEITHGTLNLRVRRIYQDQIYEIDTPTLAFNVTRPGQYRIDVDPQGRHTTVAVWDGGGDAYGENASFPVRDGEAIRFFDPDLKDYAVYDIPRPDEFDRFCLDRDERLDRAASLRYVPEDLVGYSDLDDYGTWNEVAEYGAVWYPTRVSTTWAPYRDGHWIWQDPFGWTWVDDAPWGFAPFHYGRWAHIDSRWGWVPGPIRVRPVYAPALVAFVGGYHWNVGVSLGGGGPVGWFPLGPREVYVPPYRASRRYFTGINVTNTTINNTVIVNSYNDYSSGRAPRGVNYAYRGNVNAITAVPGNVFVNARPVNTARIAIDHETAARAEITGVAAITPVQRSVMGAGAAAHATPQRQVIGRSVVARNAPAPAVASFAQRQAMLQRDPDEPAIQRALTETPRNREVSIPEDRVRIVGGGVNVRAAVATPRGDAASTRNAPNSALRTTPGPGESATTPVLGRDFGRAARERPQNADAPRGPLQRDETHSSQRANPAPRIERGGPQRPIEAAPQRSAPTIHREAPQQPAERAPSRRPGPGPELRPEFAPQVQREMPQRAERRAPQHVERSAPAPQREIPAPVQRGQSQQTPQRFERPAQQRAEPQRTEHSAAAPQHPRAAPEQHAQPPQRIAPTERSRPQRGGDRKRDDDTNQR